MFDMTQKKDKDPSFSCPGKKIHNETSQAEHLDLKKTF